MDIEARKLQIIPLRTRLSPLIRLSILSLASTVVWRWRGERTERDPHRRAAPSTDAIRARCAHSRSAAAARVNACRNGRSSQARRGPCRTRGFRTKFNLPTRAALPGGARRLARRMVCTRLHRAPFAGGPQSGRSCAHLRRRHALHFEFGAASRHFDDPDEPACWVRQAGAAGGFPAGQES